MKKLLNTIAILGISGWAATAQAQSWQDISTTQITSLGTPIDAYSGKAWGCGGQGVNRLNGDVYIHIIAKGIWKSTNKGASWSHIDNNVIDNTVGGRCESGWGFQVDQENPKRVACFTLDGDAGYTPDGTTWKKFTSVWGRNWDFGDVDWGSSGANVLLAGAHESGGIVYKSSNGGTTWTALSISMNPVTNMDGCMLGVMDSITFIYSNNNGINRSSNNGATWNQVSTAQPRSKVPVRFNGAHYLCSSLGLLVSTDKGATWQVKGSAIDIWQGPFFGANENTMVAAGPQGVYKTVNAGTTWTKISDLQPNIDTKWHGSYCWDPINNAIYATSMLCPAYKKELGASSIKISSPQVSPQSHARVKVTLLKSGCVLIASGKPGNTSVYTLSGSARRTVHLLER